MSYHILNIDSQCSLTCQDGQIVCRSEAGIKQIPVEDVASVLITSFSVQIHSHLLLELAKHGVSLILCECFKPTSLLLPANRATDTVLTRRQVELSPAFRSKLWEKTIWAKCRNQASLIERLAPACAGARALARMAEIKHPYREARCARLFWKLYAEHLELPKFIRDRGREDVNQLLNYGYGVLLSTVLQKAFALGLDPTFGISHVVRERATPLAYDLMEPFRCLVEWRVAQWIRQQPAPCSGDITPEFRRWITRLPLLPVVWKGETQEMQWVMEKVFGSFRKALKEEQPPLYEPWRIETTKWDGCS